MPIFPTKENEIYALSARMLNGFQEHPVDFPSAKRWFLLLARLRYHTERRARVSTVSSLRLATKDKNEKLRQLKSVMKECLKKSQVDCYDDPKKLALIGWAATNGARSLEPPNCPRNLRTTGQANGTVKLSWDKPENGSTGGYVRNYLIQRRQRGPNGFTCWKLIETAYSPQIKLSKQPQAVTLEYRVLCSNKAGKSLPSNVVEVVL